MLIKVFTFWTALPFWGWVTPTHPKPLSAFGTRVGRAQGLGAWGAGPRAQGPRDMGPGAPKARGRGPGAQGLGTGADGLGRRDRCLGPPVLGLSVGS